MNTLLCRFLTPEQTLTLNSNLSVWFNPQWMNSIATLYQVTPKVITCMKNDNPVAFLPFYEKKFLTAKKAFNPLLVYYSPIVFDIPDKKIANQKLLYEYEITKEIGKALVKNYQKLHLNLTPELFDVRGIKDAGLSITPCYSFYKDLHNIQNFFPDEMTKLRKAQKMDYKVTICFEPERHLELLYSMYKRKSHPFAVNKDGLLILLKKLHSAGLIEQFIAYKDEKIVSSMINIVDREETMYNWQFASEPDDMKNGISVFMFWNVFHSLSDRCKTFDWCGANVKETSRLKAALGGELKLFFQLSK